MTQTILLLLDHQANRELLAKALSERYRIIEAKTERDLSEQFDLCITDGLALERHFDAIVERRAFEEPALLPILLVTTRSDVGLATRHLWKTIDDVILTPIERVELAARVASLLMARRLSLEFSRRLFEESPQAIVVLDSSYAVTAMNPAAEELFGWREDDVVGNPYPCVDESTRPVFERYLREAASGSPVRNIQIAHVNAAGDRLTVLMSIVALRGAHEDLRHLLVITMDITEMADLYTKLEASEARYRLLLDSIDDAVLETTRDGFITFASSAITRHAGYDTTELIGRHISELFDAESASALSRHLEEAEGRKARSCELVIRTKDGKPLTVLCSFSPSPEEKASTAVLVLTDITELKMAESERRLLEQKLFRSQKLEAIGQLAGGIAHDFNNMLTIILGHLELARAEVQPDAGIASHLEKIERAARRSANLIRQLLAFARKEAALPTVVDVNESLEDMLKMLKRLIGEDIDLVWKPGRDVWPVLIDPAQLDQIISNLVVNARDAIDGPGMITIATTNRELDATYCESHPECAPGSYVSIEVSDTGRGMTEEVKQHIFEPFFTTKDSATASGLGLATVYGIVRQNNGFITVYSEPGKGTTIRVYLPRATRTTPEARKGAARKSSGRSATILLVEDQESILELASQILERAGHTVFKAQDPLVAVGIAEKMQERIDLLITDVVLPVMHGTELSDKLRQLNPGLKTLYISGYSAEIVERRFAEREQLYFLQKPFTTHELLAAVDRVLSEEPGEEPQRPEKEPQRPENEERT